MTIHERSGIATQERAEERVGRQWVESDGAQHPPNDGFSFPPSSPPSSDYNVAINTSLTKLLRLENVFDG